MQVLEIPYNGHETDLDSGPDYFKELKILTNVEMNVIVYVLFLIKKSAA